MPRLTVRAQTLRHPIQPVNTLLAAAAGTVASLSAGGSGDRIGVVNLDRGSVSQSVISLVIRRAGYSARSWSSVSVFHGVALNAASVKPAGRRSLTLCASG